MRYLRFVVVAFQCFAAAQQPSKLPVPLWPGSLSEASQKYRDQYVFLNTLGSELIVLLKPSGGGQPHIATVPLHNQIRPTVLVEVAEGREGYRYQYTLSNARTAKESIGSWYLIVPKESFNLTMTHPGKGRDDFWLGSAAVNVAVAKQTELSPETPPGRYAPWFARTIDARIAPGASLSGFQMHSDYRPGFTTGFVGTGDLLDLPQDWPDEVYKQLEFLEDRAIRETPLLAVGPMFPENALVGEVSQNVKLGIQRWIKTGELDRNAAFVQAVIRSLNSKDFGQGAQIAQTPKTSSEKTLAQVVHFSLRMSIPSQCRPWRQ